MIAASAIFAFSFASPLMLWWLAAAAAPLVIHLLNRRKYRELPFAAMQYLLAAMRKNSRRIQIEQWLLLLVRTLILILLVLAVAEFYLVVSGQRFLSGRRTHRVLVLDGSFSMGYKPTDRTRFDQAKELAKQVIDGSPQGDGFTLVLLADPPQKLIATPSFERTGLLEELRVLELPHGGANLPATIAAVEEVMETGKRDQPRLEQTEVLFLTDLGRVGWLPEFHGPAEVAEFRERSQRLAQQASLTVIDLGQPGAENMAVASLRTVDSFASLARELTVEAEIVLHGRQPRTAQLVELFVDERRAGETQVDLEPGGQATASFTHRFDGPGEHSIRVKLAGDLLDIDNQRTLAVPVKDQIRVLCINGKPAGGEFGGASDYLEVALAPQSGSAQGSQTRVDVALESALLDTDLRLYDAIFLANVAQFTEAEAAVLETYVRRGGGLVFFLGDQVRAENYNRRLGGVDGKPRLLPAQLGELAAETPQTIDPLEYKHPVIEPFRGQERAGLLTTVVSSYYRLKLASDGAAQVAVGLANGDPLIVEERIGQGRSLIVATSADTSWSMMPMWPSYVPIVQELLSAAMRGQSEERNALVGQTLGATLRKSITAMEITMTTPGGRSDPVQLVNDGESSQWSYADTFASGLYTVRLGPPESREELYAVNVVTKESDLAKLELDDLRNEVWPDVEFNYNTVWENATTAGPSEFSRRSGMSRYFLYPMLGLLLLEPLMAWWFGRHRG